MATTLDDVRSDIARERHDRGTCDTPHCYHCNDARHDAGLYHLLQVMALPAPFVDVTVTTDGFYLARVRGDVGFNRFLGRPNPGPDVGQVYARGVWQSLDVGERRDVVRAARARGVNLRRFLPRRVTP
jgi:hypothetical protein